MIMTNRTAAHLFAFSAACLFAATPLSATSLNSAPFSEQALLAQGARIVHHTQTNRVNFIGSSTGKPLSIPGATEGLTPPGAAMAALTAYGPLFGLRDAATEMMLSEHASTEDGRATLSYQQAYRGVPVIGGELKINLGKGNHLLAINGEIAPRLSLDTVAQVTAQQAEETALTAVAKWHRVSRYALSTSAPELSIYSPQLLRPDTSPAGLVWRMEVTSTELKPIRELVLVDAQRGHISLHFNQVDTVRNRQTHTMNETSAPLPGSLVCDETDPTCTAGTTAGDTDAVDAHQFAGDTYDFYSTTHGRDGIDDAGSPITSSVHWNDSATNPNPTCPNAFWNGSQMVYCTGLVADDVVAHELTHGVTDNTSNLFYYYQSGAINESLSDLWGEFVDLGNSSGTDNPANRWLMGEDIPVDLNGDGIPGAIRSMSDPPLYGDPDRMTSPNYWTNSLDGGGVHTNSGINNKAVYLMVDGATFNGQTVTGLGIDKVAKIYYEAQTNLLTSGADYLDLYNALYQGCQNLVGTAGITTGDCTQVRAATDAVEMNQEPVADFNPEAALCPAGTVLTGTTAFFDDMESGLGNWTLSNAGSGQDWGLVTGYATSGILSLYGNNIASASDQRAAITVALPGGHPYLHFNHAFEFESPDWDGGIVEYSLDGTNWNNAGPLIDAGQAYNGTISTLDTNPLAGLQAFIDSSHGYVSTRLNLSTLAGQTVHLRWRIGTDSAVEALGWILDDVRVYACDSQGSLAFSAAAFSKGEDGGSATITVTRSGGSGGAVGVDYQVTGITAVEGSDFVASAGTLNWADTDSATKSFTIPLINDTSHEYTETLSLTLSSPTGGATLGTPASATLTITDDDSTVATSGGGGGGFGALGWPFILFGLLLRLVQHFIFPGAHRLRD